MLRCIVIRNHRIVIIVRVLVCLTLGAFLRGFLLIGFVGINDRILLLGQTGEPFFQFSEVNAGFQKFFLSVKRNAYTLLCLLQISFEFGDLCMLSSIAFSIAPSRKLTIRCQLSAFAALPSGIE